ncbi:hypothetical protein MMARJ_43550 [Mycobacterium marseillense]|uniref:DUF4190 domain-containing protein n=2 Tax=Mycobacterium marseillense TaxID=701042 RepID=A0ABM7JIC2_9MYCO|nr:hypothetical protein MMARJ_43550 [Mycobacterium marseillense]
MLSCNELSRRRPFNAAGRPLKPHAGAPPRLPSDPCSWTEARVTLGADNNRRRLRTHGPDEWDTMSHPDAPRNEVGVASLLLGLVGLITCWMMLGVPFGIAAVVTGDIARRRVARGEANNRRTALAGTVLGAIAILLGLVAIGYYARLDVQKH